jgi:hypothetical protein
MTAFDPKRTFNAVSSRLAIQRVSCLRDPHQGLMSALDQIG